MLLLYCDETNFQKRRGDFFVYGGVIIDSSKAAQLATAIEETRNSHGVPRDFLVKFNPGPKNLSHEQFVDLKRSIIQAAVAAECKLLVNLCLHDIAPSPEKARLFGINTLCFHFDRFLSRLKDVGLVLIDRFEDKHIDGHLKEKLAVGVTGPLPYGNSIRLDRIIGYHYSAIGQSHFCSLVDILLGSLRFAINSFTQQDRQHEQSAGNILRQLAPLFLQNAAQRVYEISLCFRPKQISFERYRAQCLSLQNYLAKNGIASAQIL